MDALQLESPHCAVCGAAQPGDIVARGTDFEYATSNVEFSFVRCARCAHVYLNPRPRIESASVIYPEHYYAVSGIHQRRVWSVLGRVKDVVVARRIGKLVEGLPAQASLLEAGCGDGSLLVALRKRRPDLHLTGLDLRFAGHVRHRLQAHGIDLIESAMEDMPLDRRFDMVVMNQVIEHLWDPGKALAKINAVVGLGGLLSISTPNLDGYDRRLFEAGAWGGYHFPRHLNLFTSQSLSRFVEAYGFRPVRTIGLAAPLVWTASMHNFLKIKRCPGWQVFQDSNLVALALATAVDAVASRLGGTTSNQQLIAEKIRDIEPDRAAR